MFAGITITRQKEKDDTLKFHTRIQKYDYQETKKLEFLRIESKEKIGVLCERKISTTHFMKIDDDSLERISLVSSSTPKIFHSFVKIWIGKINTQHLINSSDFPNPESYWRSEKLQPYSYHQNDYFSVISSKDTLKITWDKDVREYLDHHDTINQILTRVVEKIVFYIETVSNLNALKIRFLKDPDDPNPSILLEVHSRESISTPNSFSQKKKMRSILTQVVKDNSSDDDEYIKIRAFISLILREG